MKTKKDKTAKVRQARRVSALDRIARRLGFSSWSELGTCVKRGEYILPPRGKK